MTFAEKLTELRKQKGWSQEELGDKLDVTRQTVSKWELGLTTPEMEKLLAMSELFGITTDELIKGTAPERTSPLDDKLPEGTEVVFVEKRRKFGFEYKSEKTWRGMPLVHINLKGAARGVFAIGLAAKGIIAIGLASLGVISIGLVSVGALTFAMFAALGVISSGAASIGILSLGGVSVGVFSMGGVSAGVFSFGGISAGWLSLGGMSVGTYAFGGVVEGEIAVGGTASGIIAIGESVDGDIALNLPVTAEEFRAAVAARLPNTPQFIINLFERLIQGLTVGDIQVMHIG